MKKEINKKLITCAEEVLQDKTWECFLFKEVHDRTEILDSYNGQVSALGVSILMTGLKPTLAVYYQDSPKENSHKKDSRKEVPSSDTTYRIYILEVITRMLDKYRKEYGFNNAESLVREVLRLNDNNREIQLKTDILNCSVALKQVIRTYKLV